MKKILTLMLLGLLLTAGACKKAATGSADEQAIKQSLETYLTTKKSINLKGVKVDYKNFQIAGDQATVDVLFQSGPSDDMTIGFKYTLKKDANGWEVVKSEATSGSMFGGHAGGAAAEGAPVTGGAQLPPGHPMVAPPPEGPGATGMAPAHKETPQKK